ncbi:MAG: hypothetical protein PHX37_04860 [Eubacteriales bacterium]|nr:hypothetical protein [Eubacteriales bacterium]
MGEKANKEKIGENSFLLQQIINSMPYPLAIFDQDLFVTMVNQEFKDSVKLFFGSRTHDTSRINTGRISDPQLSASIMNVFLGETVLSEGLKSPFEMFSGISKGKPGFRDSLTQPDESLYDAVVFPVPAEDSEIIHGAIVFMKKRLNKE